MGVAPEHIPGTTYHRRKGAVTNAFSYGIDYVLIDPMSRTGPRFWSRSRWALMTLRDRDHGGAPGQGRGLDWVRDVVAAHDLAGICDGRVLLLAQPRVLGHIFNPVSFWLLQDRAGALRAVIAEVSNTFGDRHSYLTYRADRGAIRPDDVLQAEKIFHVSPFQPIAGGYRFQFDIQPQKIAIRIDYTEPDGGVLATLTGPRQPLTNGAILRAVLRRPFGSRRVLGLIHWQALKLWWKGAEYRRRPEPPQDEVSR